MSIDTTRAGALLNAARPMLNAPSTQDPNARLHGAPLFQHEWACEQKPQAEAVNDIPAPVQVPTQLPPPRMQPKPLTYNVVVTEVPVKELLFSLARDTKLNIDVHPNIQGVVTLNAINETLPAILDRIANQVNIRYKLEGDTLVVTPDTPFLKSYQVNYVNLSRKTTSSIGVATQVATTGTGGTCRRCRASRCDLGCHTNTGCGFARQIHIVDLIRF